MANHGGLPYTAVGSSRMSLADRSLYTVVCYTRKGQEEILHQLLPKRRMEIGISDKVWRPVTTRDIFEIKVCDVRGAFQSIRSYS